MNVPLKTIEECRLELVAHTMMVDVTADDEGEEDISLRTANWLPVNAARASFGKEDKTGINPEADRKLMQFLSDEGHTSVFEHQSVTFLIECPMFVRSQIMRHRTFSYNEISRRYTSEQIEFWMPSQLRKQAAKNKQCSDGVLENDMAYVEYGKALGYGLKVYEALLASGVCREQARAVLPQALLTRFYMTGNLRNWQHFLRLRLDSHTQHETRLIAQRIADALVVLWPTPSSILIGDIYASDKI